VSKSMQQHVTRTTDLGIHCILLDTQNGTTRWFKNPSDFCGTPK